MRYADHQQGAIILTVAFVLLFLLGFMAIALDFGHMFVVKDELQTSMDACALSAAQELDGAGDAITRATNAGITAGNLNNVNFQSGTWSGKGKIVAADITFKDPFYGVTTVPALARYAQCQHTQSGIQMWLFQAMGAFAGSADAAYSSTKGVGALAVATRSSAQTTCPVPLGLKPKDGGTAPNYGYQPGEWVTLIMGTPTSGYIGWYNLDGSTNASETRTELGEPGRCGTRVADTLGTPGVEATVVPVWNARFGIYKNADPGPSVNHPDYSGYAYTSTNWKNAVPQNAYAGIPAAGSDATALNFKTKRLAFASYADTLGGSNVGAGDSITGFELKTGGGFKTLATPGAGGEHEQFGYSRRIVAVPVINGANQVIDYACMLMLQPLSIPMVDVQLEFVGNAGAESSPCTTNGYAGGTAGPKVPVLVQ
ncbi:pilus assembly protein TadG-related protein [Georgfuchsia toluolica]|nr:pilus assembly protein TadG-related protein [Georgfuchsia toluolica]